MASERDQLRWVCQSGHNLTVRMCQWSMRASSPTEARVQTLISERVNYHLLP